MENSALNAAFGDLKCDESTSKRTMLRNVQALETADCCNCPVLSGKRYFLLFLISNLGKFNILHYFPKEINLKLI